MGMNNFQFWIYVIIAVIYVIAKARKKASKPPVGSVREQRPEATERPGTETRPVSFEELLREITESKKVVQESRPVQQSRPATIPSARKPEIVDYDDNIPDEIQQPREIERKKWPERKVNETSELYEKGKKQAFQRPSLETLESTQGAPSSFGRFKEFEQSPKNEILEEYLRELKNPEGFKKALILSELINRRYF